MKIGGITIESVLDGSILSKLHATRPFPEMDSPLFDDQHGMIRTDGLIDSTLGAFLIRTADRLVLVDAGAGQPFPDGYTVPAIDFNDPDDPIAGALRSRGLTDDYADDVIADLRRTAIMQGRLPLSLEVLGVRPDRSFPTRPCDAPRPTCSTSWTVPTKSSSSPTSTGRPPRASDLRPFSIASRRGKPINRCFPGSMCASRRDTRPGAALW
jgi:hypothetical protein